MFWSAATSVTEKEREKEREVFCSLRESYLTMGTGWRRARSAFGLGACASAPADDDEHEEQQPQQQHAPTPTECRARSEACSSSSNSPRPSPLQLRHLESLDLSPDGKSSSAPSPSSPLSPSRALSLFRSGGARTPRSSCPICLESMKPGHGHALFTAECSHSFHFQCIASNVRHGNLVCPVCRAQWKEVPWQGPNHDAALKHRTALDQEPHQQQQQQRHHHHHQNHNHNHNQRRYEEAIRNAEEEQRRLDPVLRILDDSIANFRGSRQGCNQEPAMYHDDEPLDADSVPSNPHESNEQSESESEECSSKMQIALFPEYEWIPPSWTDSFNVLVRVKASGNQSRKRAPIDLVTVLDVSGSMSGTKLSLLKRAMTFVIGNLSGADRLAVVAFASTARRALPLRRMTPEAHRAAARAVDRLIPMGGTNIADGVRKGAKVLADRRFRNPVAAIMLLSDGQDTYNLSLLGLSACSTPVGTPVHTFGFGSDHDAATLHAIAERTGGTFSFVQSERLVQDAFAQCIGGLLTVSVQELRVTVSCTETAAAIRAVHAGSYATVVSAGGTGAGITLGDLYADESRDILLELHQIQASPAEILSVECNHKDPVTGLVHSSGPEILSLRISDDPCPPKNAEVDKQQRRVGTANAIAEARAMADRGDIAGAREVLEQAKGRLQAGVDAGLGQSLQAEIAEIQDRMASRQIYERFGRAFVLSAESSHFRQRATTRGESFESYSREYQTPSMADMVLRSQSQSQSQGSATAAWVASEKLAKVALLRKSCARASDASSGS